MSRHPPDFDVPGLLPSLRRYARSLTRDPAEAEDLVQDALVRAYEHRHSFRPGGELRAWLLSLLHNTFVSAWRSRRASRAREARAAELATDQVGPAQEGAVRLAQLRDAFLDLPEDQRATFHLVVIEGLSYAETAALQDIPVGTVMSRLARARATLRNFEAGAASPKAPPRDAPPRLRIVGGQDDPAA